LTRAGKEPAEDVKRAIRRAIEIAGLETQKVRMFKAPAADGRVVFGTGSPAGWPHDVSAIELFAVVGFDGSVSAVDIRCAATDGDPLMEVYNAPYLQKCRCPLADLTVTLKEVWVARREVISRLAAGETPPIFDGKWTWMLVPQLLP
jgi:hypothetical protein